MSNQTVLDSVAAKFQTLEAAFERFDALNAQRSQLALDLKATQDRAQAILTDETLDHNASTSELIQCRALTDVLTARLQAKDQAITAQKKLTLESGRTAQDSASAVLYAVRQSRLGRARTLFAENFSFMGLSGVSPATIAESAHSLIELRNMGTAFEHNHHGTIDANLQRMRGLRDAFEPLRTIVENEPELEHSPTSPALTVVAKAA